jgi:hypothetical protein
MKADYIH